MLRALLLGLVGLLVATGATAAPTPRVPSDGSGVVIPFDPGVGTVARFRLVSTETETENGQLQPALTTQGIEQFRFLSRNDKGYVVEYTSHDVRITGPEAQARLVQTIIDSIGVVPVLVQLDPSGKPIQILNLEEVNETMNRVWDMVELKIEEQIKAAGAPPEATADIKTLLTGMSAPFRNMTQETAVEQLLTSMELVGGWGGADLVLGKPVPFRRTIRMSLLDADVDVMGTIDPEALVPGGSATLAIRAVAEPKSLQAAVTAYIDELGKRMSAQIAADKQAEFRQGMAEASAQLAKIRLEEEGRFTLSLSTGLSTSGEYRTLRGVPGVKDTEIKRTITLLP